MQTVLIGESEWRVYRSFLSHQYYVISLFAFLLLEVIESP